jgi:hypothetical protein
MSALNAIIAFTMVASMVLVVPLQASAIEGKAQKTPPPDASSGSNASTPPVVPRKDDPPEVKRKMPVYKPPQRGTPGSRVAAGTRGEADGPTVLSALVPDHIGLTTQEQPALHWFVSQATKYPVEFTFIASQSEKPLVEKRIEGMLEAGIHTVRLADYGIRLKTGTVYRWFISIITEPDHRSKDIVTGGEIERIDPPAELLARLDREGKNDAPGVYAEAGLWYDALSAVCNLIDAGKDKADFEEMRASLLEQVTLSDIARWGGP